MKKISFIYIITFYSLLFGAPGIDPKHPQFLTKDKLERLYKECENPAKSGVKGCEKAMLFEMHYKENIHKGIREGLFDYAGEWVDALDVAVSETKLFYAISFNTDTSMMNNIQSSVNLDSSTFSLSNKLSNFSESVSRYHFLMDTVMKQTLVEFKIESLIFQEMAEENNARYLRKIKKSTTKVRK